MNHESLIKTLQECAAHCSNCATQCLGQDPMEPMVKCIRTDLECAEVCEATARLLAMDATSAGKMVELCDKICQECAEECTHHEHAHCQACARACEECSKACEKFESPGTPAAHL